MLRMYSRPTLCPCMPCDGMRRQWPRRTLESILRSRGRGLHLQHRLDQYSKSQILGTTEAVATAWEAEGAAAAWEATAALPAGRKTGRWRAKRAGPPACHSMCNRRLKWRYHRMCTAHHNQSNLGRSCEPRTQRWRVAVGSGRSRHRRRHRLRSQHRKSNLCGLRGHNKHCQ